MQNFNGSISSHKNNNKYDSSRFGGSGSKQLNLFVGIKLLYSVSILRKSYSINTMLIVIKSLRQKKSFNNTYSTSTIVREDNSNFGPFHLCLGHLINGNLVHTEEGYN